MTRKILRALMTGLCLFASTGLATADRIKDMASVAGVRSNALVGYGLVMGLAGTGDGGSKLTQQSMQSLIMLNALVRL